MNKFDPTTSTMLFQIAVDGYSSCGKSTLAKAIARELNLLYIDSGAMYRSVAYYCLSNKIENLAPNDWDRLMSEIEIKLTPSPDGNQVFLNQTDVTTAIRNPNISKIVSEVSAVSSVRRKLVEVQRSYATERPVVMDGRDIGTVVFPDAAVKLFITADLRTRSLRRWNELRKKGIMMQVEEIEANLLHRDHIDSTRADSPLTKAQDAIVIDNTHLTEKEQLDSALEIIASKLNSVLNF